MSAEFESLARGQSGAAGELVQALRAAFPALSSPIVPALLDDVQAAALWNVSVRRFHELRAEAWMPKAVVLGPRQIRWHRNELEQAIAAMPRQEARQEPAQLLRGRIERLKRTGVPA